MELQLRTRSGKSQSKRRFSCWASRRDRINQLWMSALSPTSIFNHVTNSFGFWPGWSLRRCLENAGAPLAPTSVRSLRPTLSVNHCMFAGLISFQKWFSSTEFVSMANLRPTGSTPQLELRQQKKTRFYFFSPGKECASCHNPHTTKLRTSQPQTSGFLFLYFEEKGLICAAQAANPASLLAGHLAGEPMAPAEQGQGDNQPVAEHPHHGRAQTVVVYEACSVSS